MTSIFVKIKKVPQRGFKELVKIENNDDSLSVFGNDTYGSIDYLWING